MPPIPPIPIHANDPILPPSSASTSSTTAAKADGITPRTANPPPTRTTPAAVPATTTATADPSLPPPPQPGARPVPPSLAARETGRGAPAPPQPAPGVGIPRSVEATVTSTATYQAARPPPAQLGMQPPTATTRGTDTTGGARLGPGPTTVNLGPAGSMYQPEHVAAAPTETQERRSLEHPPGYVQDAYASADGSAAQRRVLEDARAREQGDGGVGGAVWGALGRAGEALRGAEEAVWRSVGKKG